MRKNHSCDTQQKEIAHLSLAEQHLDQMPLTQAYLKSVIEATEAFQIRWVRWATK